LGAQVNGFYRGTAGGSYTHPTTPGLLTGSSDGATTFSGGSMLVPYSAALNTSVFTAETWINPTAPAGTVAGPSQCAMASFDVNDPRAGWLIYMAADGFNLRLFNQNSTTPSLNISGGGAVVAGTWYHLAVSFDGTTARLYVNGALAVSGYPTSYIPATYGGVTISARIDNNYVAQSTAEELAIYTNALSAGTIAAHYSAATTNGTGYAAQILAANPVGYWRLGDATWADPAPGTLPVAANSGYLATSAQGIYQPGMTTGAAGPGYGGFGGATVGAFNGMAGYVDCSTSVPELSADLTRLTLMTWVKFGAFNMNWQAILSCGDHNWLLQRYNNKDVIGFRFGGTDLWNIGGRSVNDGKWHHIAATYDGAFQKIYIDGTLEVSGTKTGSSGTENTYPICIGNNGQFHGGGDNRTFNGNIGEVAVFTNALAASDIWAVYSASWTTPIVVNQAQASPTNTTFEGATVTLNVTAAGAVPLAYQWAKNGTNISGASVSSYLLTSNATLADSGNYSVVITNAYGAVTSSVVLTISGSAPFIVTQPASITRIIGTPATFTVVAGGSFPRSYQWKHGTTPVPGGTAASLTLPSVQWADAGSYTCAITNAYGGTNTASATLTVGGEFGSTILPDTGARDRHVALGSDGTNLFFTLGKGADAGFYRMSGAGWTTLAPIPLPATVDDSSGVGDMSYFGGALWTLGRSPGDTGPRCVYSYDLSLNAWAYGANLDGDGPNAAIAVMDTTHILGGWIGWDPVKTIPDWQAASTATTIGNLPGGAVHAWDACIGPDNVYYLKHWNVAAHSGVLASINKTGTPSITNIAGMPINPGMGCAVEYMPASLF
ncbi:MAG: immunoglobulin domain-containing protein, partial [Verrucomicrobia bacterium]|nr:immunoglobulin domain-containing protein [Verrucomicrobiota bacterium]